MLEAVETRNVTRQISISIFSAICHFHNLGQCFHPFWCLLLLTLFLLPHRLDINLTFWILKGDGEGIIGAWNIRRNSIEVNVPSDAILICDGKFRIAKPYIVNFPRSKATEEPFLFQKASTRSLIHAESFIWPFEVADKAKCIFINLLFLLQNHCSLEVWFFHELRVVHHGPEIRPSDTWFIHFFECFLLLILHQINL